MATSAIAGFGSAKCTNEEAYLFQKLIRTRFRNNNVDHCTRLCHASSVAALIEGIGSGAVTATFNEVEHADVVMIIGANPTENHPVAATFFKQAAKRGAKLIVIDPRGQAMREYATYMLQFKPASDVALLNAIMHVIVEEGLYDVQYLQAFTENFESLKKHVASYSPESVAATTGIDAKTIREVARTFGRAERAMIFWGMGISQHVHGTDNARCLIALSLDVRPGRPAGHRASSVARPEQRAGRLRRRPDPDVLSGLCRREERARSTRNSSSCGRRRCPRSPA